jgi:hypothetical protein
VEPSEGAHVSLQKARMWSLQKARMWSLHKARMWSLQKVRMWNIQKARMWSLQKARMWSLQKPGRMQAVTLVLMESVLALSLKACFLLHTQSTGIAFPPGNHC